MASAQRREPGRTAMPNCQCQSIHRAGDFVDFADFASCHAAVEEAVRLGTLQVVSEPEWRHRSDSELGAAGFYQCMADGTVWMLLTPEHAQRGWWKPIRE